jgi:CheY-like chemotaxis protein
MITGVDTLTLAAQHRPHAAILDIGMPGRSGYEVAQQIRREAWSSQVILIAVTGWGQEEYKRAAQSAGFDHHLTKPVDLEALEASFYRRAVNSRGSRAINSCGAKKMLKLRRINGLCAVVIKASRQRAAFIVFLTPASESDQGDLLAPRFVPDALRDFVAVHIRHPDIDHTNLRFHGRRHCQGFA